MRSAEPKSLAVTGTTRREEDDCFATEPPFDAEGLTEGITTTPLGFSDGEEEEDAADVVEEERETEEAKFEGVFGVCILLVAASVGADGVEGTESMTVAWDEAAAL